MRARRAHSFGIGLHTQSLNPAHLVARRSRRWHAVPPVSETDALIENSARYAAAFDKGDLASAPARKVAVLACMDARLDPARLLGLEEGDAHVIRNAGGVASDDAIRSLSISQHLLGTEEVIVLQHTDCGMLTFTDEEFVDHLERETSREPDWPVHTFEDLDENVRDSRPPDQDEPVRAAHGQRARLRVRGGVGAGCARCAEPREPTVTK